MTAGLLWDADNGACGRRNGSRNKSFCYCINSFGLLAPEPPQLLNPCITLLLASISSKSSRNLNRGLLEFEHSPKRVKPIRSSAKESMRRMKMTSLRNFTKRTTHGKPKQQMSSRSSLNSCHRHKYKRLKEKKRFSICRISVGKLRRYTAKYETIRLQDKKFDKKWMYVMH